MEPAIIPVFGMVAGFGLSGTNCLVAHVSAINSLKNQKNGLRFKRSPFCVTGRIDNKLYE